MMWGRDAAQLVARFPGELAASGPFPECYNAEREYPEEKRVHGCGYVRPSIPLEAFLKDQVPILPFPQRSPLRERGCGDRELLFERRIVPTLLYDLPLPSHVVPLLGRVHRE